MKTNKLPVAIALLCLGAGTVAAQGQVTLSLEECKALTLQNNLQVRNSRIDVLAAEAQKGEMAWQYVPNVSLNGFGFYAFNPMLRLNVAGILGETMTAMMTAQGAAVGTYDMLEKGYSASVVATAPLYAGGRIINGNRLAALGVESAQLRNSLQERKSTQEIENDYWQVISLGEKMKTVETMKELLDTLEKDINSAVAAGLATDTDRRELLLKQNELKATRSKLRGSIRLAKMNLCDGIGVKYNPYSGMGPDSLPYIDDIVLVDEMVLGEPEDYWMDEYEIMSRREETRLLDVSVQASKLEKRITRGEVLPQVAAGVSYGYGKLLNDSEFNGAVFATLQVPITDWGKYSRMIRRYDYQLQKSQNEKEYLNDRLLLQVRQCWLDVTVAWEQAQVAQESVEVSRMCLADTRAHFAAGLVPFSDVLEDQANLRQQTDALSDARIAYREAVTAYLSLAKPE